MTNHDRNRPVAADYFSKRVGPGIKTVSRDELRHQRKAVDEAFARMEKKPTTPGA